MLNHYSFTEQRLEFSQKYLYINVKNRTPNAKRTKALLDQLEIDENEIDKEKLISVRTFINIVSLITLCETVGEKIALNILLLLIVTGMRSTEIILLKTDALIKRPIFDPVTKEHLTLDGVKQYTFGIQYHGAKGAGFKILWMDPLAARMVEAIFKSVLELSNECRENLRYIRSKDINNFLPKSIDNIPGDLVEIDDLIDTCLSTKANGKGPNSKRIIIANTLSLKKVPIFKRVKKKTKVFNYYLKSDINNFIKKFANYNSDYPIDCIFNYEGKVEKLAYEDLLFIHEYRSTTLNQSLSIN